MNNQLAWFMKPIPEPVEKTDKVWSSKVEIAWLKLVARELHIDYNDLYTAENKNGQYSIKGPKNRKIKFDGYYEPRKWVFEFNGCKYHGCTCKPEYYNEKLYNDTITRQNYIVAQGPNTVFVIWEHEYRAYIHGKTTKLYTIYN